MVHVFGADPGRVTTQHWNEMLDSMGKKANRYAVVAFSSKSFAMYQNFKKEPLIYNVITLGIGSLIVYVGNRATVSLGITSDGYWGEDPNTVLN